MDRAYPAQLLALTAALFPASAAAGAPPRPPVQSVALTPAVRAEMLFNEGRRLVQVGRYADACACFVESERLDHGVGTMLNLAECYEKNGQTASAWASYRVAAAAADAEGQVDREQIARERELALSPQLAHLTITPPHQGLPPGTEVHRDGILVNPWLWSSPVPVDPGDHVIVVAAPGKVDHATKVHVPKQPVVTIVARIPVLQNRPAPPPKAPVTVVPPLPALPLRAKAGMVLVGVGSAGVVAGAILGVRALGLNTDSYKDCNEKDHCGADGMSARSAALTAGNASTIAFVAAGAVLAGGLVLYVTAPDRRTTTASFGLSREAASVALEATW